MQLCARGWVAVWLSGNSKSPYTGGRDCKAGSKAIAAEDTETVDSPYQDGVYEGEAQGYGGTVAVELTIENGKFTDLTVVSAEKEDAAYFDAASSLLDAILEEQSTDVDTVSGATFSSNGIIHATEDALRKAEKSE